MQAPSFRVVMCGDERQKFRNHWRLFLVALICFLTACTRLGAEETRHVNLLFIITDQQRFDALGCAGNPALETPNLDRLAREGVRFTKAYTCCPVCVPARTSLLTGRSPESIGVTTNLDEKRPDVAHALTFDQILLHLGYRGEFHGKWHSPYKFALGYTRPVRWLNGKQKPPGCLAEKSESQAFVDYIEANVPSRPLRAGELLANMYRRPYRPDPIDAAFGKTQAEVAQGTSYGLLDVPPEHTHTAWTVKEGLEALERLKGGPFTLTLSISPPHPPMVVTKPYYNMYDPSKMPVPATLDDPRTDSPYRRSGNGQDPAYRDPKKVQRMIADYYGLVSEVDHWVGRVLDRLDALGLSDRTLIVFTSDHGELLGDHGMYSKFVFYEGSVHIPLIMRLPSRIPARTVVQAPVSHLDLFATILDYCGFPGHASEGQSLRPLIDGKDAGAGRFVVSEWAGNAGPAYMVFDSRWKLLFGRTPKARALDALYDLESDPGERHNLLAHSRDFEANRPEAERLKGLLVEWLGRVDSPHHDSVKSRPVRLQAIGANR